MEEKAKVPKLRFPGFTGEWKEQKLGDIMERYENPVVTPHTGYIRLGIRSHAKGTFHNYVEPGEELETAQMYEVIANNFIVNITFAWEQAVAITDKDDIGKLVSHRFPQFRFIAGNVPQFFKYVITDARFKYHLGLSSPGGAGRNRVLNINEMLKYVLRIPSREEQERLGKFLDKIDENIKLQQYKLEHLQTQKKSLLQKMFPKKGERFPELRFPGFTDAWEQHKLGELAEFNPKTELPDNFEYVDLESVVGTEMVFHRKEKRTTAPSRAQRLARQGDLFYQMVRPYQKNNYLFKKSDSNYVFSTGYAQMRPNCDSEFLFCLVQTDVFVKYVSDRCTGTSYPVVNVNELANMEVAVSNNNREQKQIGNFFIYFDNLINLHQRKLTHLQTQKKALLQQMFV